ncbi:phospholipase A2-like protein [Trypanosoma rangeli]|uniref:1-alkyl-2-acetylglycerophosphocholine esterase n=1 Tax=Trypanosoma rangeli TaxID=5698 RepID=A0A3R7P367_TRYRA|nr:phospholipase A2-like protein [Trypanosoma rangeli]RNF12034.1 phospholipase A2-like protein [Trypanosoma rangeli]|eukprot:RNF12034.1 phospholipase A2-like protein [Trypanosoma rangeli]
MKITLKDWLLSLHFMPLEFGMLLTLFMFFIAPTYAVWSLMLLASGSLCTMALLVVLPLAPLKSRGTHHVGIRHLTRDLAVYYPTFIKPIEGESWLPGNDSFYIHAMAATAGVGTLWLKHLKLVQIPCTRNASIVSLMAHDGTPRKVFILSHALTAHHLAYSQLALALASSGALVYSVLHSDCIDISVEKRADHAPVGGNGDESLLELGLSEELMEVHLERRIEDIVGIIEGISGGQLLRQLHVGPVELQSFLSSGSKINLIGHGFGALTMLAAAIKTPAIASCIYSITALDAWPLGLLERTVGGKISMPLHTRVQLVDSEEWCERQNYSALFEELRVKLSSAGVSCLRTTCSGTDHKSIMDMGLLLPLIKRKRFSSRKSAKLIPLMAKEVLQFAE